MEKVEYFIVAPSIKTFGGIKVDKETKFDVYNDDGTVHQTMENLVLTTEITRENEMGTLKSKEESKLVTEMPEGTVIVWSEETGYIIPNYHMVKVSEAIEMLEEVNNITKPIEEGTNKIKEGE